MDGPPSGDAYREGRIGEIRDYCETDVVIPIWCFCASSRCGVISDSAAYAQELALVRASLTRSGARALARVSLRPGVACRVACGL